MDDSKAENNKAIVLEAFDTLFNKRDYTAAERFWSPAYIQHSAHIEPGRDGLFNLIKSIPPTLRYEPGVIVAEGDFVIIHGRFSGLVAGAQGVSGRAVVEHYSKLPETMVYGLSRRELPGEGDVKHISVDLLNATDIQAKLSAIPGITHLFFGAYVDKQDAAEKARSTPQKTTSSMFTNGDTLRWKHMWPRIGKMFDMEIAEPVPFLLTTYLADKAPVWDAIVKKQGLQPIPYQQLVSWGYGDFAFRQDFDNVSSTIKVRQAGFHDCIDSETMFSQFFQKLAENNETNYCARCQTGGIVLADPGLSRLFGSEWPRVLEELEALKRQ